MAIYSSGISARRVLQSLACLLVAAGARGQSIIRLRELPGNGGFIPAAGLFFDIRADSVPVAVEGLTVATFGGPGETFRFELLIRDGTALGGTNTTGPGSSRNGWISLGELTGIQGVESEGVSLPITVPRFVVEPGHTTGVALYFTFGAGPIYYDSGHYATYDDGVLRVTAGDGRNNPFYPGQTYFSWDQLIGSIVYEPVLCYPNCDFSTVAPILNVNDFVCFLGKFAAGDSYANCDQSTTPPILNVNDFVCFTTQFAQGCS